jgi:hypothetical protein
MLRRLHDAVDACLVCVHAASDCEDAPCHIARVIRCQQYERWSHLQYITICLVACFR